MVSQVGEDLSFFNQTMGVQSVLVPRHGGIGSRGILSSSAADSRSVRVDSDGGVGSSEDGEEGWEWQIRKADVNTPSREYAFCFLLRV